METKKAVGYIRISSTKQIDNESPATQREAIQRFADINGLEVVEWFEDIAKTGKNADRGGLQDLLSFCMKHKQEIDHWVVYNMKRASRDIDTYSSEVRMVLRTLGVSVRSATEPAVDDTKEGRFMENLLVMLGQLDNEGKSEVTIDNMRSLAAQGYWQHPPVVGYESKKIPNELGKMRPSLAPNAMSDKVARVLERFSSGDISKAELARYAIKIGLRSRYGKKIGEDSINRMLGNPVYAGMVCDKLTDREMVQGKHPPLISLETFRRNQILLNPANSRKNEVHLQKNKMYPLKGLIRCTHCTLPLYASAPKTGSGSYSPRYHCARSTCKGKAKSVKAELVHSDFEKMLKKIKPNEGVLKLYRQILIREANGELGSVNKKLANLRGELNRLDDARLVAIERFSDNELTLEEKDLVTRSLNNKKLSLSSELDTLERQQTVREADIDLAIKVMESVDKQWSGSDIDLQMRFQNIMFPRGVVYDPTNGRFGTSEISQLYRCITTEKGTEVPEKSYLVAEAGLEPATSWL